MVDDDIDPFGMDPQFDQPVDKAQITETLNKSLPPRGTYRTNPDEFGPMNVFKAAKDFEDVRRMIILSGKVVGTFKDRGEITTFIRNVKISPDARRAKQWVDGQLTGAVLEKDDTATLLWAKAVRAYEKTYTEMPKQEQQVIDFLVSGEYKLRIRPFNGELYVGDILGAKER